MIEPKLFGADVRRYVPLDTAVKSADDNSSYGVKLVFTVFFTQVVVGIV